MAVEMRYAVVRDGKECAVFASREEADAHDAMLERAEALFELLEESREVLGLDEGQIEQVANLLAHKAEEMQAIFGKGKPAKRGAGRPPKGAPEEEPEAATNAAVPRKLQIASG